MRQVMVLVLLAGVFGCIGCGPEVQSSASGLVGDSSAARPLYVMPAGVETRWASPENWAGERSAGGQTNAGRKGSPCFRLAAGESKVLAEVAGRSGTIHRIWATISDRSSRMLRGLRFEIFWDGASKPAVSAPMGDFFCHGLGRMARFESALFTSPEGRSFNCFVPMPFRTGMKVVVTNETEKDLAAFYYDVDYTLGDRHGQDVLYFHSHWRRENPTKLKRDYELLPLVQGRGRFLGVNVGVITDQQHYFKTWWGEGEVKVYLDGDDKYPTLCGTGTEDYIGSAWGQGRFVNMYTGCPVADFEHMQYCFYRLHVPDPVYFRREIRVTIHQIGAWSPEAKPLLQESGRAIYKAGPGLVEADLSPSGDSPTYGLFERQDDWSSCAYFYLDRPVNNLPTLAKVAQRVVGLGVD